MTKPSFMLIALLFGGVTHLGCDGGGAAGSGGGGNGNGGGGDGGGVSDGGGGDGGGACTDPATQCPPAGDCVIATCNKGACASSPVAAGTPTPNGQVDGDCKMKVCDGAGVAELVDDDADPGDDGNECTQNTCVAGENVITPVAGPCDDGGGVVCADPAGPKAGQCVACNTAADCVPPMVCNTLNGSHTCVDPSCMDGVKSGSETDVDCGGACAPCQNGLSCAGAADCQSGFCSSSKCAACGSDTDCPPAAFCDTGANGGTCAADQADGEACTTAGQCASGFCVDGVCCATACAGACNACSAAKKGQGADGTCGSIAAGSDPDNECAADPVSSCDHPGFCDGAGACALFYGPTTVCQPQSCAAGLLSAPDLCDGAGNCVDTGTTSCGNYACDAAGSMCLASCQDDSQCAPATYCNSGTCVPKLTGGSACSTGNQCASGFCADAVCCDSACAGACEACNLAPNAGTCADIPNESDPANECAGAYACNGAGACQACGDGVVQAGEICDDGNLMNGDGCESTCVPMPNPYVLCVNPNLAITGSGPGAGNPSILNIPASAVITDVDISIDCDHTWPGDLTFTLSHGAVSRAVYDQPGVPASTYGCEVDDIMVTLDDEGAGGPVENVCNAASPGINSPPSRVPNNLLSGFDGQNMQGNWNLVVTDAYSASDDGLLTQWCLTITWQ